MRNLSLKCLKKQKLLYNDFMQIGDILEVSIESLSSSGEGISKPDGFVVFVDGGCPEDILKVKIEHITKNYAKASVVEVVKPSIHRVEPFCPMQKVCGACQLQFIDYDYQLELKRQIVQDAMRTIGGLDIEVRSVIKSPEIKEYRRKIQYPISETKNSKRILAGYYKKSSHEIVNIKYCPIQPKICDEIIDFIREKAPEFGIAGYNEKKHNGDLRHVVIRNSALNGDNLVVLVLNSTKTFGKVKDFAKAIYEKFDKVKGVCVNFNSKKTNVIMEKETECLVGSEFIEEQLIDKVFKIGANTFFQVNPKSAENIFKYVKNYIKDNFQNPVILDAYAGISAFGICVSDVCRQVVTVEENRESCDLAKETVKANNIDNVEINNMDAGKFCAEEKRKFDCVILDPPRKGCTEESLDNAIRLANTIIYVSCNPATLARDLKYLKQKGAQIKSVQPFDMFCHTFHVENVAIITLS